MPNLKPTYFIMTLVTFTRISQILAQICSCTPIIYRWELNFLNPCPPLGADTGIDTGISEAFCLIDVDSENEPVDRDRAPVEIIAYSIIEFGQDGLPAKQASESGLSLVQGDIIEFASVTSDIPDFISSTLSVVIEGHNAAGEFLDLSWIVIFTNLCETPPFVDGDSVGWMVFDDTTGARYDACALPSDSPSLIPSLYPSPAPSGNPTSSPNPTPILTSPPSPEPTLSTAVPSRLPTLSHTEFPTLKPVTSKKGHKTNSKKDNKAKSRKENKAKSTKYSKTIKISKSFKIVKAPKYPKS